MARPEHDAQAAPHLPGLEVGGLPFELRGESQDQRSSTRWQSRVPCLVSCIADLPAAHSRLDNDGLTDLACRGRPVQTVRRAWPGAPPCCSLRSRRCTTIRARAANTA